MQEQETKSIAEFITETCLKSPTPEVLGTSLAATVKAKFSTVDFKHEYGGLGGFIKDHCSPAVTFHGRRGYDLVYVHETRLGEVPPSAQVATAPKDTPWIAFSNPNAKNRLYMKQDAGTMLVVRPEDPAPPGYAEVPKVTEDDYRAIAKEFITELSPQERVEYTEIVAATGFWFPFVNRVKERLGQEGTNRLLRLRLIRLNELLEQRVKSLAVLSPAELRRACQIVKPKSQQTDSIPRGGQVSRSKTYQVMQPPLDGSFERRLAISAVELMSTDELRRIRLPLGVMADAFQKLR